MSKKLTSQKSSKELLRDIRMNLKEAEDLLKVTRKSFPEILLRLDNADFLMQVFATKSNSEESIEDEQGWHAVLTEAVEDAVKKYLKKKFQCMRLSGNPEAVIEIAKEICFDFWLNPSHVKITVQMPLPMDYKAYEEWVDDSENEGYPTSDVSMPMSAWEALLKTHGNLEISCVKTNKTTKQTSFFDVKIEPKEIHDVLSRGNLIKGIQAVFTGEKLTNIPYRLYAKLRDCYAEYSADSYMSAMNCPVEEWNVWVEKSKHVPAFVEIVGPSIGIE